MGSKQSSGAEAVWRERLARFQSGDLTVAEFCRREGVSNPSFYQWRKRLGKRDRRARGVAQADRGTPDADRPSRFLPVNVSAATAAEIELPNGIKIRVPATNAEALRTAIVAGHEVCQAVAPC
jgi:transposase-like protein